VGDCHGVNRQFTRKTQKCKDATNKAKLTSRLCTFDPSLRENFLLMENEGEVKTMPRLNSATPCFPVADVSSTMRWYKDKLAFEAHPFPEQEPHAFCILVRDQIEIMLQRIEGYQKPDLYSRRGGGVWDAYIRMLGVKEFYESVNDKVEILRPLEKQFYGDTEFEVKDPNGYVLVFSELTDD
jgi:hypothetical protein